MHLRKRLQEDGIRPQTLVGEVGPQLPRNLRQDLRRNRGGDSALNEREKLCPNQPGHCLLDAPDIGSLFEFDKDGGLSNVVAVEEVIRTILIGDEIVESQARGPRHVLDDAGDDVVSSQHRDGSTDDAGESCSMLAEKSRRCGSADHDCIPALHHGSRITVQERKAENFEKVRADETDLFVQYRVLPAHARRGPEERRRPSHTCYVLGNRVGHRTRKQGAGFLFAPVFEQKPVDPFTLLVESVVAQLVIDVQVDQGTAGDPDAQPEQVDETVPLVPQQGAERNEQVNAQHPQSPSPTVVVEPEERYSERRAFTGLACAALSV